MNKTFEELREAYEDANNSYTEELCSGGENEHYWYTIMNDIIEMMWENYADETTAYIYG